jgi:hypothetical protein
VLRKAVEQQGKTWDMGREEENGIVKKIIGKITSSQNHFLALPIQSLLEKYHLERRKLSEYDSLASATWNGWGVVDCDPRQNINILEFVLGASDSFEKFDSLCKERGLSEQDINTYFDLIKRDLKNARMEYDRRNPELMSSIRMLLNKGRSSLEQAERVFKDSGHEKFIDFCKEFIKREKFHCQDICPLGKMTDASCPFLDAELLDGIYTAWNEGVFINVAVVGATHVENILDAVKKTSSRVDDSSHITVAQDWTVCDFTQPTDIDQITEKIRDIFNCSVAVEDIPPKKNQRRLTHEGP